MPYTWIATAAFGLEGVVRDELRRMGIAAVPEQGGARFTASPIEAYKANLKLRTADRVLMLIGEAEVTSFEELYRFVKELALERLMPSDARIPVTGKCVRSRLMSVRDCQSIVKKAIVDRLMQAYGTRSLPESGFSYPIDISVSRDIARLTLDMSGTALNRRGYRTWNGEAPLRETLAAALVELSPWRKGMPLYDPCCGTGTLLIEAAMIACGIAPGRNRDFACERFMFMPKSDMAAIKAELQAAREGGEMRIGGSDIDPEALELCRRHISQAGLGGRIDVSCADLRTVTLPDENGVFLCNPPYGERMGDRESCHRVYGELGLLKRRHPTWSMGVICSDPAFERFFGQRAIKKRRLYNGRLECEFFIFS